MSRIDINGRPRSRGELPGWYSAALEEQAASGLSMTEYADRLGVAAATLYQWKRRLSADDEGSAELETPRSLGLVEVSLESHRSIGREENFVVRLGNGRLVEVPQRFEDSDLIRLLEVLEAC
jgi:transposase-like protein